MNQYLSTDYSDQAMAKALDTFNGESSNPNICLVGLRYLFKHQNTKNKRYKIPNVSKLLEKAKYWLDLFWKNKNYQQVREIVDIICTYCPSEKDNFLNRLRDMDRVDNTTVVKKTVYSDSQNVHNNKINSTVISAATELCKRYHFNDDTVKSIINDIKIYLSRNYPKEAGIIEKNIFYILSSTATFGPEEITMAETLAALWFWIIEHPKRLDLELRLVEEFKDMNGMCSTGHLARLVNVMQGFVEDGKLQIRIAETDQCKAVITQYLTKVLQDCKDEKILDGMLTGDEVFVKYIRSKISEKLLDWRKTYGDKILLEIAGLVNQYCDTTIFQLFTSKEP